MTSFIGYCIVTILTFYIAQSHSLDGNWGPWANATECSSTCEEGVQTRNRTCDDPSPLDGGKDCIGTNSQTVSCNKGPCSNITGNWSSWSNYSACSVTCGSGYSFRNRTCEKIDVNHTIEAVCNGSDSERVSCNEGQCPPINGSWSSWSNFSDCSVTCGGGIQKRIRTCDNPTPQNGGLNCEGQNITSRGCNEDGCPGFDNKGRKFIFGLMDNLFGYNVLYITTPYDDNVTGTVSMPLFDSTFIRKFTVSKGKVEYVSMNMNPFPNSAKSENKGIFVEAERDIIVYAANEGWGSTSAFVVLPVDAIGQEYYVTSWSHGTAFMIIGTEDGTEVSIKLGKQSPSITYNGQIYRSRDIFKIRINTFETFLINNEVYGDFTGTHVFASKPLTLLAGARCVIYGNYCNPTCQQILPVEKLEKHFITIGLANCYSDDTFRIVSSQANTVVNISGKSSLRLVNPGDFYTFNLPDGEARTISADKGIQLTMLANSGYGMNNRGFGVMVVLPAIQQFSSNYTFSTVTFGYGSEYLVNSLTLVITESFIQGLRLDGNLLPNTTWRSVLGRNDIKYTDFNISRGSHFLYHLDSSVTFLALSTGKDFNYPYAYPLGFDFKRTDKDCNNSTISGIAKSACNNNLDPCSAVQCLNNGTCNPQGWTNFECSCPKTYGGQRCEIDLCQPHPSDVMFLMDSSRSVGTRNFDIQKQFILDLLSNWTLNSNNFDVAVMSVSKSAILDKDFGSFNNETDLAAEISKLTFKGGESNIYLGVNDAMKIMKSRTRSVYNANVNKYIILFTDGLPSSPSEIKTYTGNDVTILIVAVGGDVSHFYLEKISGSFSNVFHPFNNRFQNHMLSDLIHPDCGVCESSNETDVILIVDRSKNLDEDDVRTHIPNVLESFINKMNKFGDHFVDTRLSLITFSHVIDTHFRFLEFTNTTKPLIHRHMHSISRANEEVANFSEILSNVSRLFYDKSHGGRSSAKKIMLIISKFDFKVDGSAKEVLNDTVDVFTVGLKDENFEKMLLLVPTPFNIGIVGSFFANQIDTFFNAFIEQLSYISCVH